MASVTGIRDSAPGPFARLRQRIDELEGRAGPGVRAWLAIACFVIAWLLVLTYRMAFVGAHFPWIHVTLALALLIAACEYALLTRGARAARRDRIRRTLFSVPAHNVPSMFMLGIALVVLFHEQRLEARPDVLEAFRVIRQYGGIGMAFVVSCAAWRCMTTSLHLRELVWDGIHQTLVAFVSVLFAMLVIKLGAEPLVLGDGPPAMSIPVLTGFAGVAGVLLYLLSCASAARRRGIGQNQAYRQLELALLNRRSCREAARALCYAALPRIPDELVLDRDYCDGAESRVSGSCIVAQGRLQHFLPNTDLFEWIETLLLAGSVAEQAKFGNVLADAGGITFMLWNRLTDNQPGRPSVRLYGVSAEEKARRSVLDIDDVRRQDERSVHVAARQRLLVLLLIEANPEVFERIVSALVEDRRLTAPRLRRMLEDVHVPEQFPNPRIGTSAQTSTRN